MVAVGRQKRRALRGWICGCSWCKEATALLAKPAATAARHPSAPHLSTPPLCCRQDPDARAGPWAADQGDGQAHRQQRVEGLQERGSLRRGALQKAWRKKEGRQGVPAGEAAGAPPRRALGGWAMDALEKGSFSRQQAAAVTASSTHGSCSTQPSLSTLFTLIQARQPFGFRLTYRWLAGWLLWDCFLSSHVAVVCTLRCKPKRAEDPCH